VRRPGWLDPRLLVILAVSAWTTSTVDREEMTCEWMDNSAKAMATFKFLSRRLNFGTLNDAQMLALDQLAARSSGCVPKPSSPRTACCLHRAHSAHLPSTASAERATSSNSDPDPADPGPDPDLRLKRRLPDDHAIATCNLTKRRKGDSDNRSNVEGGNLEEVRRQRISIVVRGRTLMSRVVTGPSSGRSPDVRAPRDTPTESPRLSTDICFQPPSPSRIRAR
jgi:hypothetical protein